MTLSRVFFWLPLLGVACQGPGPTTIDAPVWPQWSSQSQQFHGSALGGPIPPPSFTTGIGQLWTLNIEVIPLQGQAPDQSSSVVEHMAWAMDPSRAQPILPAARSLENMRWLAGEASTQWRHGQAPRSSVAETSQVALAPGQTFHWSGQASPEAQGTLGAFISRPKGGARGYTLSLSFEHAAGALEIIELDTPWRAEEGPVTIFWTPDRPDHARSSASLALHLSAWRPDLDSIALADAVQRGTVDAAVAFKSSAPSQLQDLGLEGTGAETPASTDLRLQALAHAQELGSEISADWLLTCNTESVRTWLFASKDIPLAVESSTPELQRRILHLDALCLLDAIEASKGSSKDSAAFAFLIRQTGQLAFYPDSLIEWIQASRSPQDLQAKWVLGNQRLLKETQAGPRLRAFDWLHERGMSPPGYDPLQRSSRRQQALQRWSESQQRALEVPASTAEGRSL